jgi:arylsulfatase A-like enzyme
MKKPSEDGNTVAMIWLMLNFAIAFLVTPTNGRTSIVFMLADDVGFGDVGYNSNDEKTGAKTPNLNDMSQAIGAIRLDNFHSPSSVCSPSRAAFLSGRLPDRDCVSGANTLFNRPDQPYHEEYPMRNGMPSVAMDAKRLGYATAFFGKFHLSPLHRKSPGTMGFDTWIATEGNAPTYDPNCLIPEAACLSSCKAPWEEFQCYRRTKNECSSRFTANCTLGHYPSPQHFSPSWNPHMYTGVKTEGGDWKVRSINCSHTMTSAFYVDKFEEFVKNVPQSKPIFAYIWFNEPHHPFIPSPELAAACMRGDICKEKSDKETKEIDYHSVIVALDRAVGRVRNILRNAGRAQDTILIFTSDVSCCSAR